MAIRYTVTDTEGKEPRKQHLSTPALRDELERWRPQHTNTVDDLMRGLAIGEDITGAELFLGVTVRREVRHADR